MFNKDCEISLTKNKQSQYDSNSAKTVLSYNQNSTILEEDVVTYSNEIYINECFRIVLSAETDFISTTSKKSKKTSVSSNISLDISPTHKVLSDDGWVSVNRLRESNYVYIQKNDGITPIKIKSISEIEFDVPTPFNEVLTLNNHNYFLNKILVRHG